MMELSVDAKRKLVEGALGELGRLEKRKGEFDPWEEHYFIEAVADMEAGAYGLAMQKLSSYAKRPSDRDRVREEALASKAGRLTKDTLRQKLEALRAALA